MCEGCYNEYGRPRAFSEEVRGLKHDLWNLYQFAPAGGPAHLVCDDWNIEDENIDWCLNNAFRHLDLDVPDQAEEFRRAQVVLQHMRSMSIEERATVLALWEGIIEETESGKR